MNICVDSILPMRPAPLVEGGSIPTSALHLRKEDWWVRPCSIADGRELVEKFHYAKGASNTRTYLHGLWKRNALGLFGCAWWIPPTRSCGEAWAGELWRGVLNLSRLVISPDVPTNACSYLLSKSVKQIDRSIWHTLITYSDHWRGHTGAIYRAVGWEYCGETKPEATYTLNGKMTARKAGPKTRTHQQMLDLGAKFEGRFSKSRWRLK